MLDFNVSLARLIFIVSLTPDLPNAGTDQCETAGAILGVVRLQRKLGSEDHPTISFGVDAECLEGIDRSFGAFGADQRARYLDRVGLH